MHTKITRIAAGIALAGALTVGTAGAAFAADGSGAETSAPAAAGATKGHPALRAAIRRGAANVISDTLGVSRQDLRTALQDGQTISQYATSLGKDPQTVVDALTSAANAKLDQLAANGRITAEREAKIQGRLPTAISKLMNHQFGQHAST